MQHLFPVSPPGNSDASQQLTLSGPELHTLCQNRDQSTGILVSVPVLFNLFFFFLSSKYVLSCYHYCGSGIQVLQLRWVPLAQDFSWDSSQTVSLDFRVSSEGSTSTRSSPRSLVRLLPGLIMGASS